VWGVGRWGDGVVGRWGNCLITLSPYLLLTPDQG
jgi:hypothetical protein